MSYRLRLPMFRSKGYGARSLPVFHVIAPRQFYPIASMTNLLSLISNLTRVPSFKPMISANCFGILTARLPPILKVFRL
jgi:hypothetical protein